MRAGVSIVPSLIPHYLAPRLGETLAVEAFHHASPLEDIADPHGPQALMRPLADVDPDVAEFMRSPQIGARRVVKALLERVHTIRMGQSSAAPATVSPSTDDAVFPRPPSDHGHFAVPYMTHILGGLRHRPPDYVQDLLDGRTPPPWVSDLVAGIVVVRDPEPATRQHGVPREHGGVVRGRHLSVVQPGEREPAPDAGSAQQAG